ncbi:histone-lysine N-methyltransferase PRDM9-like isoform X2 [Dreissena polymorpha]|uniref:histone-lysine N-methyltransferase PRDM9-like isoform X2 n=1 Tax=Dreissena polymorpha TaxID=45954 RepID=UPI0022646201|nr:histone-lysine N-methyltransferase PRDM9-like isoform X2 [Dreissena polymorpha]
MESENEIINDFDSTTQTSVNTMSARVSVVTLNSDRKQGDFSCVCVKMETDEWYTDNTAADLYSGCAKSEQVLWEERQPDCNKQDAFNVVHEQRGCLQMDQDYTKQDGLTSECVKSEQMEYEILPQDVTRQACVDSVCVNKNTISNSNAYTAQDEQFLNPNTDQSYITTNDPNYVCGIAKQYVNTDTDNENRTENDPNALCDHSNAIENQAQLAYLNSVFPKREEIELSNVDQYCTRPTVGGERIQKERYSNLDVHRHSNSEKDDSEILLERDKRKRESCHATLAEPNRFLCEDSSSGVVQPMSPSSRDSEVNAVTRTVLSLKPAKIKLNEKGDRVKKVKRMKKAKTLKKDKTEYSHQERNLTSCMNLEPRDNDHFLYCGECNSEFEGDCPVHGPYNYIQDKEVPEVDPLKADHTVPDCLVIKTSKIAGAGLGVFSKEGLESRVMFGPYGGNIFAENQKSGYCWQVKEGKASHFVDAQNKATSNWMRYVNCAMTEADKNLVAFQYKGGIYYCTLKQFSPGEELLVWYGDEFAKELGLIRDKIVCSYSSKNSGHVNKHKRIHTGLRQYTCEVCGYLFKRSDHLKTHMSIHTGERPYKCEECDYDCKHSHHLKIHMRIHTGERPYKCEECDYACKQSSYLKIHMRIHTGERQYKCGECGYECKHSGNLKIHMRIHTGERPYKCEECDYACKQSSSLKIHMRIHTGERQYKCGECGYECKRSGDLKRHMRIHTGESPYTCKMCDYACKESGSLKRHMRIHTGESPYTCKMCDYACKASDSLKKHMRIHTGESPYTCKMCDYACKASGSLKKHMRIHTGEKLYKSVLGV